jgi:hypothetical protein
MICVCVCVCWLVGGCCIALLLALNVLKFERLGHVRHSDKGREGRVPGFQALGVNLRYDGIRFRNVPLLGLDDFLLDLLADSLFGVLDFLRGHKSGLRETGLDVFDGISVGSGELDLVAVSVGRSGVGHGMSVVPVGHHLHVHWSVAVADVFLGEFHPLGDGQNVHPIDAESGNGISHLVIILDTGVTVDGGSHTVVVVFDAKNHGL